MAFEPDEQRWNRLHRIFNDALGMELEDRKTFLKRACRGDEEMRREVVSLLASHEQAPSFLEEPAVDLGGTFGEDPLVGQRLGPYKVLSLLGSGGMGRVYRAERADEAYEHQVAVKVLRQGLRGDGGARRFLIERQILAHLDHPMIARLLDGGTTADGRPYIVMEHIEGEPIDRYCDEQRQSLRQRLELFRDVCSAVQFAHRSLVVHRDLKPGNILIGADGVPKLLDFGIAKLLREGRGVDDYTFTATDEWALTPAYASPEQIQGEPITIGSDVYSLGVLLYELVCSQRPYRLKGLAPLEVARVICQEEPARPSTVVEAGGPGKEVSRCRSTDPARLRRSLAGDVDDIVMMALDKDPRRRYASVEQLSEDLRRHLQGLPVKARANTPAYRAGKFLRRHRWKVAAAATALALILGFAVTSAIQRQQFLRQRDVARQVSEFFVDMFDAADPTRSWGDRITAREVLDGGARRIVREMEDQPELRAALMGTMGRVYVRLGLYDDARSFLEESLAVRHELGSGDEEIAESLHHLALLRHEEGDYEAAEKLLLEALELRRAELGEEHVVVASMLSDLGGFFVDREDPAARGPLEEALRIRRKLLGREHVEIAYSLNNLAQMHQHLGDYKAAQARTHEALAMLRKLYGEDHVLVAYSLNNLAGLIYRQGDPKGAEDLYRQALGTLRRIHGEENPIVAQSLNNLAVMKYYQSQYGEAEDLYREALAMRRASLGDEHPHVAMTLNNLGVLLRHRGDLVGAEQIYRESLALRRKSYGEEHPLVARALNNLARVLDDKGEHESAETMLRQALAMYRKTLGERHPDVGPPLTNLAAGLVKRGDCAAAEPMLNELMSILGSALDAGHWRVARVESLRGACLVNSRRYEEAEGLLVRSYEVLCDSRGEEAADTRWARESLEELYRAWGRPEMLAGLE